MSLRPKRILFGVSGGIAAYKAPDVLHGWVKLGCEVETILTEAAEQFVSPLALSTLSKRRVWRERDFLSAHFADGLVRPLRHRAVYGERPACRCAG